MIGPAFNDRFGDVYGNIYAFTSDGLSQRELRDRVEDVRAKVLTVKDVGRDADRWNLWVHSDGSRTY